MNLGTENEPYKTIEKKLYEVEDLIPKADILCTSVRWDIQDLQSQLKALISKLGAIESKKKGD